MRFVPVGKVAVAVAGQPQALALADKFVSHLKFTPTTAVGKVYIGGPAMVKGTDAGVAKKFYPPGANGYYDAFEIGPFDDDIIDTTQFAIDADNNGEGPLVSYLVS